MINKLIKNFTNTQKTVLIAVICFALGYLVGVKAWIILGVLGVMIVMYFGKKLKQKEADAAKTINTEGK